MKNWLSIFYEFECRIVSNSIQIKLQTKREKLLSAIEVVFIVPIENRIRYNVQQVSQQNTFLKIDIYDPLMDKLEEDMSEQEYVTNLKDSLSKRYKVDVLLVVINREPIFFAFKASSCLKIRDISMKVSHSVKIIYPKDCGRCVQICSIWIILGFVDHVRIKSDYIGIMSFHISTAVLGIIEIFITAKVPRQ